MRVYPLLLQRFNHTTAFRQSHDEELALQCCQLRLGYFIYVFKSLRIRGTQKHVVSTCICHVADVVLITTFQTKRWCDLRDGTLSS